MKLGTETGSLINHFYGNASNGITPEVGMGVTFLGWTDRHPGTINKIETKNGKTFIYVSYDLYKRIDDNGFSESQEYEYTSDPEAHNYTYRFNEKTSTWENVNLNPATGRFKINKGNRILIGRREKYHDFSF